MSIQDIKYINIELAEKEEKIGRLEKRIKDLERLIDKILTGEI